MNIPTENINVLWSGLIIEELIRHGIDYFCISPGSRSTPLTTAVARHSDAQKIIIYDERSAAFHALGYARATGKPAVLICTSGTAVANYLPAAIEAYQENLPLVILSADRPPELRDTGANQTIDQIKILAPYVRWFFDMPTPSESLPPQFVLDRTDRLVDAAFNHSQGPTHLNCMFREPLAPRKQTISSGYLNSVKNWLETQQPFTTILSNKRVANENSLNDILQLIKQTKNGLLILGGLPADADKQNLLDCLKQLHWPTLADITSGLRLGFDWPGFVPHFDLLLNDDAPAFDTVIHLGGRYVSKRLMLHLQKHPPKVHVQISPTDHWLNPSQTVTHRLQADVQWFCDQLQAHTEQIPKNKPLLDNLKQKSQLVETILQQQVDQGTLNQPAISRIIARELPQNHGLFLANSLSVREMDMFAQRTEESVFVAANRGTSGIDGNLSTATGFTAGLQRPVTLLIGDLAFLHDLNALGLLRHLNQQLIIVLINNGGGGIFHWLPIAQFDDVFETYFATPHDFHFAHSAKQFGLDYRNPGTLDAFREAYIDILQSGHSALIEVQTDRRQNAQLYRELLQSVKRISEQVK